MATDPNILRPTDNQEVTLVHHGTPHTFSFFFGATIEDLSDEIAVSLSGTYLGANIEYLHHLIVSPALVHLRAPLWLILTSNSLQYRHLIKSL